MSDNTVAPDMAVELFVLEPLPEKWNRGLRDD